MTITLITTYKGVIRKTLSLSLT